MFSIRKLFGKEEKFFDLLEASAEEARASTALLGRFLQEHAANDWPNKIDDFVHTRRKDKRITQQITEELCLHGRSGRLPATAHESGASPGTACVRLGDLLPG